MRKFFRATYSVAVIALFLVVAVLGLTQTKVFRSYLRTFLIRTVATELHDELVLASIEGNLFTGFQVENVVLRHDGEPVLTVERLEAKYDPLGMLTKSVAVSRLTLTNPVIHFTRSQTGAWNFEHLLRSSSADTTPSSWTINLKQLQIKGGALRLVDSLSLARRALDSSLQIWPGRIDYANVQLDSLDLEAGLGIRSRQVELTLRSLTCRSPRSEFQIRGLAGDFLLTATSASVRELKLETAGSHLQLDARIDSTDITKITSLAQFQFIPVSARLDVERLDFGELKQLIGTPVRFLEREIACQIVLEGRFGLIDVRNITLRTGSTVVRIVGTVANLHNPGELELNLACVKNKVDPVDIRHLMPTLGIPDLSALGVVEYELRFKGKPMAFNAQLTSSSHVGKLDVDGNVDFRGATMSYDATVKTSHFNVAPLAGDSTLTSSLKTTMSLQGRGTRLADLTCTVRTEIDSSEFYGLPVTRSVVVMDAADRTIRPRVSLRIGSARVELGGTLQIQPLDVMSCDLSGRVNSLNLAELTKNRHHDSDVSFDLQARAKIKSLGALAGDLNLNFFRSSFDTVQFEGGAAAIRINTLDREPRAVTIASEVFDLDVQGHFTPVTVVSTLARGATLLGEAIRYRISSLDSLRSSSPSQATAREFRSNVLPRNDTTDYKFKLTIKDCFPIGVVLGKGLDGRLTANGYVREEAGGIHFDGTADAQGLRYADRSFRFSVEDGSLSYDISGLSQATLLQSMGLSLAVRAKRFEIGSLQTANLAVDLNMRGDSSRYWIEALLDSVVTVRAEGTGTNLHRQLSLDIQRLQADFHSYVFENTDPVRLKVGRDGLQVTNLLMHHEDEELNASGYIDPGGISDVTVAVHNLFLNSLPKVYRRAASGESQPTMSGVVNAVAGFQGSFEEPRFSTELNATGVQYEDQVLGRIQMRSSYADRLLNFFAELRSRTDSASVSPDLLVNGTVPYNLSLKGGPERKLEGEMNLDVRSNNLRLEVLDPFIPEFSNLSGIVVCDMKLRGTVESPSYEGSLALQNARFLFNPLGIRYIVDGKLVPHGRQIALEDVTVRNVPDDRPDGKIGLSGSFSLEGLKIRDFDITANGQLLVMKEIARRASQGLYGDLFGGTGPDGVKWKGSPSRSFVSGEVSVKYANLTLPPTRQTQELPNSRIVVTLIDDRKGAGNLNDTKQDQDSGDVLSAGSNGRRGAEGLTGPLRGMGLPPRSNLPIGPEQEFQQTSSKSFLDNIVYNLAVETQGVTQLRFIFSDFTNEQLLAELKGRTTFTKDGEQMRLTGELDLGNRSYYNNFKKLDATGKLKFTGDPLNPELDIVARYEGVHRGLRDTVGSTTTSGIQSLPSGARGSEQKVVVKVFITGTRDQPKVKMGLEQYDPLGNLIREERGDVEGDAIAFLVTGTFRDELTQQDRLSLAGSSVLGGVASSILSGPLTDLLRKEFGIVRSVDVLYYGGSFQESADVRLTGELGDAVFRLGGRVLSDLNNTNVSIQLPMSAIVGSEKWRNLVLEAERRVQGVESIDQRRESRGLRLLYRIIF